MKLGKRQKKVICLMSSDWELAQVAGRHTFSSIQKGGAGRGGTSIEVHNDVVYTLRKKGIIEGTRNFPFTRFSLTEKGKNIAEELLLEDGNYES